MPDIPAEFSPSTHDRPKDVAAQELIASGHRVLANVEYAQIPGYRPLRLDVHFPEGEGPHPVVVYIHGGAFRIGSRRENWVAGPLWRELLAAGFAVATVEYRLSAEALFPACVNDVCSAVRWLSTFGDELGILPAAIGVIGESAGGYLSTFLGMNSVDPRITGTDGVTEGSSHVRAAVAWYPVTDLAHMDEQRTVPGSMSHGGADSPESLLVGVPVATGSEAVLFASPIEHASADAAPMLLIHGERDRAVPCAQSITLAERLATVGAHVELDIIKGGDHVFAGVDRGPIIDRTVDFFLQHLRVD
jgi:acetyl esterase/lipase